MTARFMYITDKIHLQFHLQTVEIKITSNAQQCEVRVCLWASLPSPYRHSLPILSLRHQQFTHQKKKKKVKSAILLQF